MIDALDYIGNSLHTIANLGLLVMIWRTGKCSGISVKSRNLYALVFVTRHVYLLLATFTSTGNTLENTILQSVFFLATLTTILVLIFCSKTHEKEYDTARVGKLLIPCILIALSVNHRFGPVEVLWMFSVYLEAVAMVPQFHFTIEAKRIGKPAMCYLVGMFVYKALCVWSWDCESGYGSHWYEFAVAAGLVQLVLYGDFFLQILPWLCASEDDEQPTVATVESAVPKVDHLAGSVATI